MNTIIPRPLPEHSLLSAYNTKGYYTDCFAIEVARDISQQQFVTAFYTSRLFKVERFILKWLVTKPSTDQEAKQLAIGSTDSFAAWTVEGRMPEQLLLCDYQGRTRSWLMVEPIGSGTETATQLFFGTGVVSATNRTTGRKSMQIPFHLLLGFHRLYARALLRSAAVNLAAGK
ncbi:hypothetical protein [Sphingobium subterraneum]|uniref:DUF2867 domain-containing protein n=1 Tax=Sphingobium subterraneum TaxID=627688 RepID=A0A841J8N2_9SPHN|nr:hypothetical protein [Sphingobium subterraneum]MBB6124908.1 hypothetical protein [Sphingobium subterraneum]